MAEEDYVQVTTQIEMNKHFGGDKKEEEIKKNNVADENQVHILIVTVKRAEIAEFCRAAMSGNCDAYCEIMFDEDKSTKIQTGKIYRTLGHPRWNFSKRYVYKSRNELPKQIKFTVWHYDDDSDTDDEIGSYTVDLQAEEMFSTKSQQFNKECDLDKTKGSILVRIAYKCTTFNKLKLHMKMRRKMCMSQVDNKDKKLNKYSIKWIDDNKELFTMLKKNKRQGLLISEMDFGDLIFPPYQLIRDEYKMFLNEYRKLHRYYEIDKNGDGYQAYYDKELDVLYYDTLKAQNYGGQNITNQVLVMWRYVFLKNVLLKGADSEFNIYRSYYFDEKPEKVPMALLALIIQVVLTAAISIDVYRNFEDTIINGDPDIFIVVCSILVFCFISVSTNATAKLFVRFYKNIDLVFDIPWFFRFADFMSNIVIALVISAISLLFLLQTQEYSELVLNSFALTFIFEIDDMINIFDSDESYVIIQDLREYAKTFKSPRKIQFRKHHALTFILSPFMIFDTLRVAFYQMVNVLCRSHKRRR